MSKKPTPTATPMTSLITKTGRVDRVIFNAPDTGYSVFVFKPEGDDKAYTVVGNFLGIETDHALRIHGNWVNHPTHGRQFQVEHWEPLLPAEIEGIRAYLMSNVIDGIGPVLGARIVEHFGLETFKILDETPNRVREVEGIGDVKAQAIIASWSEHRAMRDIQATLMGMGISAAYAVRVYKEFGGGAVNVVTENPYKLTDVAGIGFKTADKVARKQGVGFDDPRRVLAGVEYALEEAGTQGHIYLPHAELITKAAALLAVNDEAVLAPLIEQSIAAGVAATRFVAEADRVFRTSQWRMETYIAQQLRALLSAPSRLAYGATVTPETIDLAAQAAGQLELSDEQRRAVLGALQSPLSVVTGGPGVGKTTCIKTLVTLLKTRGTNFALTAPTGRAAKRLGEATGAESMTLHRLLGFGTELFGDMDLDDVDFLVIDESSMLDQFLMWHLLRALNFGTHVVFVGDADQLPSVGAGNILRDLIASGTLPVTRLGRIFRQAATSDIVVGAHAINAGRAPDIRQDNGLFLFSADDATVAGNMLVELVTKKLPARFGVAADQIQVLAPMYRGAAGVDALNQRLQAALNPPSPAKAEHTRFGRIYREGDRVLVTANNYNKGAKGVFNGDVGYIASLTEAVVTLLIGDERIEYKWAEAEAITHAYAVTIHKSQGSEFPVLVMPIITEHYIMLTREILYTGVTRAKRVCVLVGQRKAINMAVGNADARKRYTALAERLRTKD